MSDEEKTVDDTAPCARGHREGPGHDCDYVDWRDSLIPIAERSADAEVGRRARTLDRPSVIAWGRRWDAAFHRHMDAMTHDDFFLARRAS